MDYIGNKQVTVDLRRLACVVLAGASMLGHTHLVSAQQEPDLGLTIMELDDLLAAQETATRRSLTGGELSGSLAQSTVPPLDALLADDVRAGAVESTGTGEVIRSESGTVTVTGAPEPPPEAAPAAEPAPAAGAATVQAAAQEVEAEAQAEQIAKEAAADTGGTTAAGTPAEAEATVAAEDERLVLEAAPQPMPPALNNLPNLPPLAGAEDGFPSEPDPNLFGPDDAGQGDVASSSISTNVTINLIARLVERGVLTQGDAQELIQVAHAEAEMARQAGGGAAPDGSVRVTYVPEVVKAQIRDEVRDSVMAQARDEGWAAPDKIPDWIATFQPFGDLRLRYEYIRLPEGNDNTGAFPNFNSINSGSPFDVSGLVFSPQYNVDQDRQRVRLRARIGTELNLGEGFTGGIRLATGDSNSPVSPNQTLGGSGGNFSKYSIWLDRAFIKYELGREADRNLALTFGRFDNPFFSTDLIWDDDLGFDGVALTGRYRLTERFTPFVAGGLFPVYNTDLNYSSNQPAKFESDDKYLYGGQIGFDLKITEDITLKLASSYYDFENIEGRLSDPYAPISASDAGNTDATRPSFAQKGNTYRPLRNIIASPLNDFGTSNQFQYFGLATPFRELAFTGRLEINSWEPYQIALVGEYVQNLDFEQEEINAIAVNNRGPSDFATGSIGEFDGGDTAWFAGIQFGKAKFEKAGDWNATFGYRYVESDAVVDAFTDSDFGGGGTNVKGYVIGTSIALSPSVRFGLRWMTSDEVAGPPFKVDTIQVDLTAKF